MEKCRQRIYVHGRMDFHGHQCANSAVKDGYCMIHHPDSKKARQEKSRQKFEEKMKKNPLLIAMKQNAILREKLKVAEGGLVAAQGFVKQILDKNGGPEKSYTLRTINKAIEKVRE